MDSTLQQLRNLLVQAIPTILFFIFLAVFLRSVFFRRIGRILEQRRKATEGVRELAEKAMAAADRKHSEFEEALKLARAQVHRENDVQRREWLEQQAKQIAAARAEAEQHIENAKLEIAAELKQAESDLGPHVNDLARQIAETLMRRSAA